MKDNKEETSSWHSPGSHAGGNRHDRGEGVPRSVYVSVIREAWPFLLLIIVGSLCILTESLGLFQEGLGRYSYLGACAASGALGLIGLILWTSSEINWHREALRLASMVATGDGLHSEIVSRSPFFDQHWKAVSRWAELISREMGLPEAEVRTIRRAAEIMDIGMLDLLDEIGDKALDERSRKLIEEHPVMGENILRAIHPDWEVLPLVRHHHERFDGSGYPDGLKGEEIPMGSRVLAVADSLVAMASERGYRERLDPQEIVAELRLHNGSQFDPGCVEALMRVGGRMMGAFEDPKEVLD
ncbi:MAG: HD domain-containing protein [Actinobacteria bacterium]|nr:HD domain-containing protein [Actinomycetota bacterium]MCG2818801.1 HD domain-containing protein [Actinomycetes bacterium]MBU4218451.1 HD domain-containing protein [Actinomycetota bacterium]MBU4359924.1 HD domain-containing protein [Actinomycetota bacterium]MBU4391265.1 HD domain-containing protein [Actinomycetota bacterium]